MMVLNMKQRFVSMVLLCMLCGSPAFGKWVSLKQTVSRPSAPVVSLLQDDRNTTVLKIDIPGFEAQEILASGRTYTSIDLLTTVFTTEAGYPELPCIATLLAVPDRATLSVEVIERGEEYVLRDIVVPPARSSWKEGDAEPPYTPDDAAYRTNEVYPGRAAELGSPAIFRDFRIARAVAYPVQYIAATKELRVASSLTIRIRYGPGDGENPKLSVRKPIAPSYAALYRSTIFNYQTALERDYNGMESGRDVMLCFVPDAFYNSLLPFVAWRNKTGTQVIVTKFSEIGANSTNPDIIKNYIAQVFHAWQYPPTYILLAGGYGYVPIKQFVAVDGYTLVYDDYYVEIDGNDFIPEIMIGRFTHKTDGVEQIIVNKIVGYERTPYTANTAWFKKAAVVADKEYPSDAITKRFTRDRMMLDGGFTKVDTFMSRTPCYSGLTDLLSVLNEGRSFLNYRGQAWYTGWNNGCYDFSTSNISSLNNGRMLTFVTNVGCGAGAFNQNSNFGEAYLEVGTTSAPRGAVTFIGPSSNTHTAYNNVLDVGMYAGLFQEGLETPGQAITRGRMQLFSTFGNTYWSAYMTRIYNILGDPSVHVWKDVPKAVAVNHPVSIAVGYNQASVTVMDSVTGLPVRGATVCLAGRTIFTTAQTDVEGTAILPVSSEIVDTLTVLVRGGNVIPYEGSVYVTQETEHVAPFGQSAVSDLDGNLDGKINPNEHGRISFVLKNWGMLTSSNVQATLSADTSMVEILTLSPSSFGSLAPGDTASGSPFEFFVKPTCNVGDTIHFRVHIVSSSQSWNYLLPTLIRGCSFQLTNSIVDDQSSARPNARLDPGETAKLYITVKNAGDDIAPNVHAVLRCANAHVTIVDSLGTFGTCDPGSVKTNHSDYFVVRVDSTIPVGTRIPFVLAMSTASGSYLYAVLDTALIGISVSRPGSPTGPDAYGYYAYGSDDTVYQQAPKFDWFEIKPIGTIVPGSGGNYTSTVTLPFSFKYYGLNYTQLRISSDGWIAFGSGTQTSATNNCLPYNDAINCMVAPFWDDLIYTTSLDSQKVYYYADVSARRFIVEWYYVSHSNTHFKGVNRELFQVILSDGPTTSSDGQILVQYKNIEYPTDCSVGMEDNTQTLGLSYICNNVAADESVSPIRSQFALLFTTRPPEVLLDVRPLAGDVQPSGFMLEQNYPNPFNPTTTIRFRVPAHQAGMVSSAFVTINVYDVLGRELATIVNETLSPGEYTRSWDARSVPSGVYFYRLQAGPFTDTKKLVVIR
jgi:hypothetical protein